MIETHEDDEPETAALLEKCQQIEDVLQPLLGDIQEANTLGAWANALVIVAGTFIGMVHEQSGYGAEDDAKIADSLRHNILNGVNMGRAASRVGTTH